MARQRPGFTIKNAIICDDIRKEDSGKYILIGVYGENITVSRFPFSSTFAFWISVMTHREGEILCQWKMTHDKLGDLSITDGKITIKKIEAESPIPLRQVPVQVHEAGVLSLKVRESEGRWRTVKSIPIRLGSEKS